jgi:hypothetical protein
MDTLMTVCIYVVTFSPGFFVGLTVIKCMPKAVRARVSVWCGLIASVEDYEADPHDEEDDESAKGKTDHLNTRRVAVSVLPSSVDAHTMSLTPLGNTLNLLASARPRGLSAHTSDHEHQFDASMTSVEMTDMPMTSHPLANEHERERDDQSLLNSNPLFDEPRTAPMLIRQSIIDRQEWFHQIEALSKEQALVRARPQSRLLLMFRCASRFSRSSHCAYIA